MDGRGIYEKRRKILKKGSANKAPCHSVDFELRKNIFVFFSLSFFFPFLSYHQKVIPEPSPFPGSVESNI